MSLFDVFKGKTPPPAAEPTSPPPLAFRDGAASLEYACKFLECPLHERSFLPAMVVDARTQVSAKEAIDTRSDGNQVAVLRVASPDGGFIVVATTLGPKGPKLQVGDLVAWQAGKLKEEASIGASDKRSGWVGVIIGTLKPELRNGRWLGDQKFST